MFNFKRGPRRKAMTIWRARLTRSRSAAHERHMSGMCPHRSRVAVSADFPVGQGTSSLLGQHNNRPFSHCARVCASACLRAFSLPPHLCLDLPRMNEKRRIQQRMMKKRLCYCSAHRKCVLRVTDCYVFASPGHCL